MMMRFVMSMLLLAVGTAAASMTTLHLDVDQVSTAENTIVDISATQKMLEHYQPPCAADEQMFEISGIPGTVRIFFCCC